VGNKLRAVRFCILTLVPAIGARYEFPSRRRQIASTPGVKAGG